MDINVIALISDAVGKVFDAGSKVLINNKTQETNRLVARNIYDENSTKQLIKTTQTGTIVYVALFIIVLMFAAYYYKTTKK